MKQHFPTYARVCPFVAILIALIASLSPMACSSPTVGFEVESQSLVNDGRVCDSVLTPTPSESQNPRIRQSLDPSSQPEPTIAGTLRMRWHVIWIGGPPDPKGISLFKITVTGTGPGGSSVGPEKIIGGAISGGPKYWVLQFRLDTTQFLSGSEIIIDAIGQCPDDPQPSDVQWKAQVMNNAVSYGNWLCFPTSAGDETGAAAGSFRDSGFNVKSAANLSADRAVIIQSLSNCQGFYMNTHGNIGQFVDCISNDNAPASDVIFSSDVAAATDPPMALFQFVFMDACDTSGTPDTGLDTTLASAFMPGISQNEHNTDRAYVGYADELNDFTDDKFVDSTFEFLAQGYTIKKAMRKAYTVQVPQGPDVDTGTAKFGGKPLYPTWFGDPYMKLHGVYVGDPSVKLTGVTNSSNPLALYRQMYNGPETGNYPDL